MEQQMNVSCWMRSSLLIMLFFSSTTFAREVPVRDFFRHAEFTEVELSPTGEFLAVTVPQDDRTLLAVLKVSDKSIVAKWDYGEKMHAYDVTWVNDERFMVLVAQKLGSLDFFVGNPDLHLANADGSRRKHIPLGGTYSLVHLLPDEPRKILVQRSLDRPNLFKMDVYTGHMAKAGVSPVESGGFAVDHDGNVRYAIGTTKDHKLQTWQREAGDWKLVSENDAMGGEVDSSIPVGFTEDNKKLYMRTVKGGGPAGLALLDPETGEQKSLFTSEVADIDGLIWSHDDTTLLGVRHEPGFPKKEYLANDNKEATLLASLDLAFPDHDVNVTSRTRDGRYALAIARNDIDSGRAYLFDTTTGKATFLLSTRSWIEPKQMAPMRPVTVTARDGLKLHGYLTVPNGSGGKNLPLVVNPHGGPHGPRDSWGFNPEVQFLANRGYAVLQVNYRGSGGYGRKFESAGYQKWGTEMQNDLTDSVRWAIQQGIADADRVCIYGGSYGGYAALMSVVREPELYQCSIGYVGVYSLPMMHKEGDIPESEWGRAYLNRAIGSDQAQMQSQSPAYNADKIQVPVMLVHGRKDERVPIEQMDFLIEQMAKAGKAPEIVLVKDQEGHGFFDVDNNVELYTKMEAFLEKHIGEPAGAASR